MFYCSGSIPYFKLVYSSDSTIFLHLLMGLQFTISSKISQISQNKLQIILTQSFIKDKDYITHLYSNDFQSNFIPTQKLLSLFMLIYQQIEILYQNHYIDKMSSIQTQKQSSLTIEKSSKNSTPCKDKTSVPNFIAKLYEILEKQEHSNLIDWNQDGISFFVENIKEFEQKIIPIYFRHKNFASFVRQLNMYDFHKIRGEQKHIFKHKLFRKDGKKLLSDIKRKCLKKQKSTSDDQSSESIYENNLQVRPLTSQTFHMNVYLQNDQLAQKNTKENSQKSFLRIQRQNQKINQTIKYLMEEVVANLQHINLKSDRQLKYKINQLKKNSKYDLLMEKNYIYKIYKEVKKGLYATRPRNTLSDLDQLSIQQEILYNQIEKPSNFKIVSLANFETQKHINYLQEGIKYISRENGSKDYF